MKKPGALFYWSFWLSTRPATLRGRETKDKERKYVRSRSFCGGSGTVRSARFNHAKAVRHHAGSGRRHAAAQSSERRNGHRIRRDREDAGRHSRLLLRLPIYWRRARRIGVAGYL